MLQEHWQFVNPGSTLEPGALGCVGSNRNITSSGGTGVWQEHKETQEQQNALGVPAEAGTLGILGTLGTSACCESLGALGAQEALGCAGSSGNTGNAVWSRWMCQEHEEIGEHQVCRNAPAAPGCPGCTGMLLRASPALGYAWGGSARSKSSSWRLPLRTTAHQHPAWPGGWASGLPDPWREPGHPLSHVVQWESPSGCGCQAAAAPWEPGTEMQWYPRRTQCAHSRNPSLPVGTAGREGRGGMGLLAAPSDWMLGGKGRLLACRQSRAVPAMP